MLYKDHEVTEAAITDSLNDGGVVTYLFFGYAGSLGGQNAVAVALNIPYTHVYITADRSVVEGWFGDRDPKGVVFRPTGEFIHEEFDRREAEDLDLVEDHIMDSYREG